jgi:hypothetical protein
VVLLICVVLIYIFVPELLSQFDAVCYGAVSELTYNPLD